MALALAKTGAENRAFVRDEVHYRARAYGPDVQPLPLLIVNMSAMGLMARTEAALEQGQTLRVTLPVVGMVDAVIRWTLGGRIGCELSKPIGRNEYYALLAIMTKGL